MTTLRIIVNNGRCSDLKAKLIDFKNEKESCAKFCLNQIPGATESKSTRGLNEELPSILVNSFQQH